MQTNKVDCPTKPVWWIEWKHRARRTAMVNTVPLHDDIGLRKTLTHATAFAEDNKVTVTQYWPKGKKEAE